MKLSLRSQLVLSFLAITVATAALVVVLANQITTDRFTALVMRSSRIRANRLVPLFANYYTQAGSWEGVELLFDELATAQWSQHGRGRMPPTMPMMGTADPEDERLVLLDAQGRIVADSEGQGNPLPQSLVDEGVYILVNEQHVGTLVVASKVGTFTPNQSIFLVEIGRWMVAAAIFAGLAVLLVGSFQAQRIVAPVRALAEAARRIAGGDLSQRISITSRDELGDMAAAFNEMAAKLEEQRELRHRAMADIAHELRTPLSVLQIDLESIEDGLTVPTPEVIIGLQEELALLNRLVEDLRMLSLAEAGELTMSVQPFDLAELIRATLERVRNTAREKDVSVSIDLAEPLPLVAGDDQRLAQVLINLLSNAFKHTPAGGQVTVAAQQAGQMIQVAVIDTGEGIPTGELPYIFERFYRADRARGRDTGGSGLGLSIARSLVEAHGGRMWVESVEGQGSTFYFTLPVYSGVSSFGFRVSS